MYGARTGVHVGVHSTLTFTPALPLATLVAQMFANNEQGVWYDPSDVMLTWRRNLRTYSEDINNASWIKNSCTISSGATTSPTGGLADLVIPTAALNAHSVRNGPSPVAGTPYTSSVYAKAGGYNFLYLQGIGSPYPKAYFDLSTGTITNAPAQYTSTITSVGNGWYRCSIAFVSDSAGAAAVVIGVAAANNTESFTGDGTSGIYIWGAQLELGTTPTTYQRITDGVQDYYDAQAQPTLYQDYQGTTPCTAIEQPVGLLLDKRQALTLGSDVVLNGDFSNGSTSWRDASSAGGSWTVTGGAAVLTNTSGIPRLRQTLTVVANRWYQFTYDTSGITSTTAVLSLGNTADGSTEYYVNTALTNGSKRVMFYATNAVVYINFACNTAGVMTVDNVACKSLIGNHAYQSTSAARPTLRARYNILTYSEDFTNAIWISAGSGVAGPVPTANQTTAPDGTMTADKLVFPAVSVATNYSVLFRNSVALTGSHTSTVWLKGDVGGEKIYFCWQVGGVYNNTLCTLTTSWQKFTVTFTGGASSFWNIGVDLRAGSGQSAQSASTIYIWGADTRPTNQFGNGLPDYQRIAAATDYDTVGFPAYIQGNGTSQTMLTQNIDFSATDKMTVLAGVRKLSDASQAEVCAFNVGSAGVFALRAPATNATADFGFTSGGTFNSGAISGATHASPKTAVLAGASSISAPSVSLRVNGVADGSASGSQGTGNFGNAPLYLLSRAGSSLWFGGNFYGLIIRGASSNDSQISTVERYLNVKSKAY